MSSNIFVSIASYRDPETIPTIKDLIEKSSGKNSIRIGLCLQDENIQAQKDALTKFPVDIIDYDWRESKGTCWARHTIQKLLFNNEDFYFQLDSHHRFCESWDIELISNIELLKNKYTKPIIGGYCPGYFPSKNIELEDKPMKMVSFPDFTDLGDLMFMPKLIKNYKELREQNIKTIPARFLSGHFIFAEGSFVNECMYDPNLYFRGEELSLSARAYTNGYDFFHPTNCIVWHEYLRENQRKHWDDHTKNNGFMKTHEDRASLAKQRVRQLLCMETKSMPLGKYDLGKIRNLHNYELYAGLDFSAKKVHKYAYDLNDNAPTPSVLSEKEWVNGLMNKLHAEFDFPTNYINKWKNDTDLEFIAVIFEDQTNKPCYRKDIKKHELIYYTHDLFAINASMLSVPSKVTIVCYVKNKGFQDRSTINHIRVSKNV